MKDDLENLRVLGTLLAEEMKNITRDFRYLIFNLKKNNLQVFSYIHLILTLFMIIDLYM